MTESLRRLLPCLVVLLTVSVYLPSLQNQFITSWDDDRNFLTNLHYRGLGWSHLRWMFTTVHMGVYIPLTWITLGLDYLLWGMSPAGYHLTNLLIHSANAGLFYFLALQLLQKAFPISTADGGLALPLGAAFAALLFAVHPLRVESVAWVTERRDVLSGMFYLLAILAYLRALEPGPKSGGPEQRWYWASVGMFGLALLSKSMAVSLVAILVVLDVYPLRRLGWGPARWLWPEARKVWAEKIPYVLLAAAASLIAFLAHVRLENMTSSRGVADRIAISLYALAFYLWKTILPVQLSPFYPLEKPVDPLAWPFLVGGLAVCAISGVAIALGRRTPGLAAVWISYLVTLLPVSGILQNGDQIAADRYSYLACLGWALLAGAGLVHGLEAWVRRPLHRGDVFLAAVLPAVMIAGLGTLTWKQVHAWHGSESLWRQALDAGYPSSVAHSNLGVTLASRGEVEDAIGHYRRALEIDPSDADAHNNLGSALDARGDVDDAIAQYRQAIQIKPGFALAHYNLGGALNAQGDVEQAMAQYRQAIQIDPGFAPAHSNLANVLTKLGRLREASHHYRRALQINPAYAKGHYNLGIVLAARGRLAEAIGHFRQAIRLQPQFAEARQRLSQTLARQGGRDQAIRSHEGVSTESSRSKARGEQ